jgi:RNA polymerase sigma-70 factor (ECF subfamily)
MLERALAAMPVDLRVVLLMSQVEGLTMSDIAENLALPPGTVASRLRRARHEVTKNLRRLRMQCAATSSIP